LARASVTMMLAHLAGTVTKTAKPPVVQPEFVQF
jgi:hypothetical protein